MTPYPAYRDSGLPWLGSIPAHWEILPLKYLCQLVNGAAFKPGDWQRTGIPIVRIENLNGLDEFNYYPSGLDAEYIIGEGDLLFAWSGNRGTSFGPYLWQRPGEYYLNQHIFRVVETGCSKLWLYWALKGATRYIEDQAHGIIGLVHITRQELGRIPLPLPPVEEQDAIVAFLDRKLAEIDRFIAAKERLIALLREQKAAIINRAVSRGLDPDVPMRPSGIEWLGEIPAHWEVRRAKYYFAEVDERSTTGAEELLSVSHITGVTPRSEKNITMFMAESYEGSKTCQPGDLVINIMWAWMGAAGVSQHSGIVSSSYGVYRLRRDDFAWRYLDQLVRSKPYVAEYTCRSTGITSSRLRMYTEDFFGIPMICPPLAEQEQILQHIDEESATLDHAIARAQREIELIKEFRTTLIADAVTGKIDVRSAVPAVVEEVPV